MWNARLLHDACACACALPQDGRVYLVSVRRMLCSTTCAFDARTAVAAWGMSFMDDIIIFIADTSSPVSTIMSL